MAISTSLLKFYKCVNWTENTSHGGGIDVASAITSGASENVFDAVTNDEREAGSTEYRKIFFRNENADSYTNPKCWISQLTTSPDDEIYIMKAGTKSEVGISIQCSGTAAFTNNSVTVTSSTDLSAELAPGEKIYAENDGIAYAKTISSISGTTITLSSVYTGAGGASCNIMVAPVTSSASNFKTPTSRTHADVLQYSTLIQNAYCGVWIKRVVNASADGEPSNTGKIRFGDS